MRADTNLPITLRRPEHGLPDPLDEVREMVRACMQCGTCTASCPNAASMDLTPRQMWRALLFGFTDEVLSSKTFWMCSACYSCTLRCPRGLPLTRAMAALKRLAAQHGPATARRKALFYQAFIDNVHKYGRVQEMDLMFHYFMAMRDPLLPLRFTPVGMKLLAKGKLHAPSGQHKGVLDDLFNRVRELEGNS
jgi:heterodisulfide reductase subunit C